MDEHHRQAGVVEIWCLRSTTDKERKKSNMVHWLHFLADKAANLEVVISTDYLLKNSYATSTTLHGNHEGPKATLTSRSCCLCLQIFKIQIILPYNDNFWTEPYLTAKNEPQTEEKERLTAEAAAAATLLLTLDPMTYLSRIAAASFKLSLARSSPSVKYWLTYGNKTLSSERH